VTKSRRFSSAIAFPVLSSESFGSIEADTDIGCIAVEPAHWHVEFFQLQPTNGGFELPKLKTVCSGQIWTSKPFVKCLQTGKSTTRYDLWISRPLDITQPYWLK
jgi:hypothetical protein